MFLFFRLRKPSISSKKSLKHSETMLVSALFSSYFLPLIGTGLSATIFYQFAISKRYFTLNHWNHLLYGAKIIEYNICFDNIIEQFSLFVNTFTPCSKRKSSALPWAGRCMYTKGYAFLAISHRAANATGSLMAISDSILRLISTPASFRPCMKVE